MIMYYKNKNESMTQAIKVDVIDITYDTKGYPHFLFYFKDQWLRKSAKYFKPHYFE